MTSCEARDQRIVEGMTTVFPPELRLAQEALLRFAEQCVPGAFCGPMDALSLPPPRSSGRGTPTDPAFGSIRGAVGADPGRL